MLLVATILLCFPSLSIGDKSPKKSIAITFDELPVVDPFSDVDRQAITYLILDALAEHDVKATGFVVGQNIEDGFDLLGEWLNDGHTLGSMTQSNQDYNEIDIAKFLREVQLGGRAIEPMLEGFGQKKRYFRFPFLHYGPHEKAKKEVFGFLKSHKVVVAHATIVAQDHLYDFTLRKLGRQPDTVRLDQLMNEYLNELLDEVERVEHLSQELLDRQPKQILLLRANRLNALFLGELLHALKEMGYTFVTLDEALRDPLYSLPESYFQPRGVGFLDRLAASDADYLPAK